VAPTCGGPRGAARRRSRPGRRSRRGAAERFFYSGPACADPVPDPHLVPLFGPFHRPLDCPVERTQEAPDMPRVILHPGQALDEPCDSGQRPQARPKTLRPWALAQRRVKLGQLLRRHSRLAASPPGGAQRPAPASLPRAIPAHDTLATDTQAAGNGPLRLSARSKQSRRLVATSFQSMKIASRGKMSSHPRSYTKGSRLVTVLCEIQ
jgi:hypothetical protein